MKQKIDFLALFAIFICCALAADASFGQSSSRAKIPETLETVSRSFEALAEKVTPTVVQIFVTGYGVDESGESAGASLFTRRRNSGSGVILDADGYVITNAHVVKNARRIQLALAVLSADRGPGRSILKPKGKIVPAKLIGLDYETDLAVLKVEEKGLPFLEFGDSDSLRSGQLVLAFGSPLGLESSVTMGVISSTARQLQPEDPMIYIQTDASINPGNSGGPLVDTQGRLVGVNTFILTQSGGNEGIGFAAPCNIVRTVFNQIRKTGRVHRSQIGAFVQTITPTLAAGLKLSQDWGVVVGDVFPGGPAEVVGLKVGDIIRTLNGKIMENGRQFDVNLYPIQPGETVTLEVLRGTEKLTFKIPVIARTDDSERFAALISPEQNAIAKLGVFGIELDDKIAQMLPSLRKQYGVVVAAKLADAPFWATGFQPGDVIHSVNGVLITGLTQLRSTIENLKIGDPLAIQIERSGRLMFIAIEVE